LIVQIYEVQSPDEARKLIEAGVDHIGVLVGNGEHPRELSINRAREIFKVVPLGPDIKRVAMSLSHNLEQIIEIDRETCPDILHLGAATELLLIDHVVRLRRHLSSLSKIMRSIPVIGPGSIELAMKYDMEGVVDYFLLDTMEPGEIQIGATGKTHDWDISRSIVESVTIPVILAGGLGPDNVAEAVVQVRPYGVDSKTQTDNADGRGKDIEKVTEFARIAKNWHFWPSAL